jgi:hypothetical protein
VIVRLVLWNLADSKTTLAELRHHLGDVSEQVPGLRLRAWISDETTERFGAIELWESADAAEQEPPDRVRELIGKAPEIGETFDVEQLTDQRE